MPANQTKNLGHAGTDAPGFAEVLLGSLQNADGMGANSLPSINPQLTQVDGSLSASLRASLAVALSGVGVAAGPMRQLPATDPHPECTAPIPARIHQKLARAESAVSFPILLPPVSVETNPVLSIPAPRPLISDPKAESIAAIPAGKHQKLAHAESAVSFPILPAAAGVETNPVLPIPVPRPPASEPRAESLGAVPAGAQQQLARAETGVNFPIPTSPVAAEVAPAFFMHSIRQPSPNAPASTRIDPASLPPQPSAEIQPALGAAQFVEPAIPSANPSETLPGKLEFAWSIQDKTNNNSPRTAAPPQITGVNTPSKDSVQSATPPKPESHQWITLTTESAQANAPTTSSAVNFPPRTQHTATPPDTQPEGTPAPTLPLPSPMKILVHLDPSALPARSAPITATQSGPLDSTVSNPFPEPKPITPAPEPMAAAPQNSQRISEEASPNSNVGTGQLPQSSGSSDTALALAPALIPALSKTPVVTPSSAQTATVQITGLAPAAFPIPNIPAPGSADRAAKPNTTSKVTSTNPATTAVAPQPFGRTAVSAPVSETIPARPVPPQNPDKDSARASNTHSQNPEKERTAGEGSGAASHLTTAERETAAPAGANPPADSAPGTANAGAMPAPVGKAVWVDTAARPNAADQPAERSNPSPGLEVWNGGDNAQTQLVQSALLASHPDRSEMKVSLEAERLGTVELQAKVTNGQIRAAIAVDRHDTHAVLASDLSALHQALNDRQLGTAHVTLFQGTLASNDALGNGTLAGRREASPQANENTRWAGGESSPTAGRGAESALSNNIFDSNGRLSVRA
jgi:flagellar hook-length control protein FliK